MARRYVEVAKSVRWRSAGQVTVALSAGWVYVTEGDFVFLFVGIEGEKLHPDDREFMKNVVAELERKHRERLAATNAGGAIPDLGTELLRSLGLE
jgi:hypothetical protein